MNVTGVQTCALPISSHHLAGKTTEHVRARRCQHRSDARLNAAAAEDCGSNAAGTRSDHRLPELRGLDVLRRRLRGVFAQRFVREEEERAVFAAVNYWPPFAEVRQVKWSTDAAAILAKEAFDSFREPAPKIIRILIKCVQLRAVVFEKEAAVKIIGTVL